MFRKLLNCLLIDQLFLSVQVWLSPIHDNRISWCFGGEIDSASKTEAWGWGHQTDMKSILPEIRNLPTEYGASVGEILESTSKDMVSTVFLEDKFFETWNTKRVVLLGDCTYLNTSSLSLVLVLHEYDGINNCHSPMCSYCFNFRIILSLPQGMIDDPFTFVVLACCLCSSKKKKKNSVVGPTSPPHFIICVISKQVLPFAGQGSIHAMLDGISLTNLLASLKSTSPKAIEQVLKTHVQKRHQLGRYAVFGSRLFGRFIESKVSNPLSSPLTFLLFFFLLY